MNTRWKEIYRNSNDGRTRLPWEAESLDLGKPTVIRRLLRVAPRKNGLELGCGRGSNLRSLRNLGVECLGIDLALPALLAAKPRLGVVADCVYLPFSKTGFDFVIDIGCFHHIKRRHRQMYVDEVFRVLKNNGHFALSAFSKKDAYSTPRGWAHGRLGVYVNFSSEEELLDTFRRKLEVQDVWRISWPSSKPLPHDAYCLIARKR